MRGYAIQFFRRLRNAVENKGGLISAIKYIVTKPWSVYQLLVPVQRQNWYYAIVNSSDIATFVSNVTGCKIDLVCERIAEIVSNETFKLDLIKSLGQTSYRQQDILHFGRRLAWYAIIRIACPICCVETGVHDGLGSSIMLLALEENYRQYGYDGKLIAIDLPSTDLPTDFPATSGWLIPHPLRHRYQLLIGDSKDLLPRVVAHNVIDFFIHDSDHNPDHEKFELDTIWPVVSNGGIIMSDTSSDVLRNLAQKQGTPFFFFREQVINHFYPGACNGATIKTKIFLR